MKAFKIALVCSFLIAAALFSGYPVLADSNSINFEAPTYALGVIDGQDGWSSTGAAGHGCAVYDHKVAVNTSGFRSFGAQSLRISDAVTSGCFGDQTFAKPLIDAVGETAATTGGFSEGARKSHFEMRFDIASTMRDQQPGMHVSMAPDRGDGSRMSYLRFEDAAKGIVVFFDDVQGTTNPANFVETQIGKVLKRTESHTIRLTLDTRDGPSNDVVKVYIDGRLVHTGTSWENYYRYDSEASAEQSTRIVKTVIFRSSGTANPADLGNGFLFDNLALSSSRGAAGCDNNDGDNNNNGNNGNNSNNDNHGDGRGDDQCGPTGQD